MITKGESTFFNHILTHLYMLIAQSLHLYVKSSYMRNIARFALLVSMGTLNASNNAWDMFNDFFSKATTATSASAGEGFFSPKPTEIITSTLCCAATNFGYQMPKNAEAKKIAVRMQILILGCSALSTCVLIYQFMGDKLNFSSPEFKVFGIFENWVSTSIQENICLILLVIKGGTTLLSAACLADSEKYYLSKKELDSYMKIIRGLATLLPLLSVSITNNIIGLISWAMLSHTTGEVS